MLTFVNRFVVTGAPAEFERAFRDTSEFMAAQPGFVRHRLARHVDASDRYVNVAEWTDRASFEQALAAPGFAPHARALRALAHTEPNLYEPVLDR